MKIRQTDGSEIEVFTAEEVKEQKEKALEEYKKENPDKSGEVTTLSTQLADANKKLEEALQGGGNEEQVKRLREARDKAEKDRDEAIRKLSGDIENFKKESIDELKNELMQKFTRGDSDLKKKIEFEFDNYRPNENTKVAIKERMEKAYQLATGGRPIPTAFDSISGQGSYRGAYNPPQSNEMTPNAIKIGNALGISDEQRKRASEFLKKHNEKNNNN